MASKTLKALLDANEFIAAPGVFDPVSAMLADRTNAKALYLTGPRTVAEYLREPEAALASTSQILDRVQAIVQATRKPLIVDGDTGYSGPLSVPYTVRGYESAGAAVIQLDDHDFMNWRGHASRRRVIPTEEMVNKIKMASDARSSKDFLILVRTGSRWALGLDESLRRGEAYAKAGADIMLIEDLESEAEMWQIGAALDVPLLSNQRHGGRTPILPQAQLKAMGFSLAIYPTLGLFAAAHALTSIYGFLAQDKPLEVPLYTLHDFVELIGFQEVWDFKKRSTLGTSARSTSTAPLN